MAAESWFSLGAGILLAVAAVGCGLAWAGVRGRWGLVAAVARGAAGVALLVALALVALARGWWSPLDLRQVALGLAWATVVLHLALTWRLSAGDAGPFTDLIALALTGLALWPGGSVPTPAQRMVPFYVQWVLFLLGGGAVIVAGSAGLALALRAGLARRGLGLAGPSRAGLGVLLREAVSLALVTLGGGLVAGSWWAWRTVGRLASGDPREGWMAITWLIAALSLLSWRLEKHPGRWAAVLAMAAAAAALVGLLAIVEVRRALGL